MHPTPDFDPTNLAHLFIAFHAAGYLLSLTPRDDRWQARLTRSDGFPAFEGALVDCPLRAAQGAGRHEFLPADQAATVRAVLG